MQNHALTHRLRPFVSMQNHHSLVYREEEREILPTLKTFGVGAIPWSPRSLGQTTKLDLDLRLLRYSRYQQCRDSHHRAPVSGRVRTLASLEELAKKKGVSMAQIAVALSLYKDGTTAPIVGTTSLKNVENIISAVNLKLTDEEIKFLEEPYEPLPHAGHM
ncbi:Aldo/keto reductase [Obba rivulosa]|uniref:Aldo/keto reductase n=1 Tax=Obba rivulosa TaxID=1052685 RepID=A0A8E2AMH4_9APHY|nr:Aldo/keto reductase [Obba rivulosa]